MKQIIKQAVQNAVLPACYAAACAFARVDPGLVVFADAHHNSRPEAMELLFCALREYGAKACGHKLTIAEHYLDYETAGALGVARDSVSFMRLYARAGCVVICDNYLPAASCRKRRGTRVIQLWHACGSYKKFGYDAKDDIPENYRGEVYRNTDLVTVSGNAAEKHFASAMHLSAENVRALGVSRTDLYFSGRWRGDCTAEFYEAYPQAKGRKVVLWAPTFRGNAGTPRQVNLDLDALQRSLGDGYLVIARLHPHMMNEGLNSTKRLEAGRRIQCAIPTEQLYPVTDVLIADYSSLIYEYLLFRKPLVLYVPDLDTYRRERGFYMQIEEIPGRIVKDESRLPEAVRGACTDQAELDHFLKKYMGACDGRATERIADWIMSTAR